MVIVSTKEFRDNQRKYFDIAEEEHVLIKRGKKYINLFVSDRPDENIISATWVKDFLSIPPEYRCNPFEKSPSGDLFWADIRNVEYVEKQIAISEQQIMEGKYTECHTYEEMLNHLESL